MLLVVSRNEKTIAQPNEKQSLSRNDDIGIEILRPRSRFSPPACGCPELRRLLHSLRTDRYEFKISFQGIESIDTIIRLAEKELPSDLVISDLRDGDDGAICPCVLLPNVKILYEWTSPFSAGISHRAGIENDDSCHG